MYSWNHKLKTNNRPYTTPVGPVAQSLYHLSCGLDGPGDRIPMGVIISARVHIGPGAHPASCTIGTGSFPRVKRGRSVTLARHPLLVPWSRKSKAIPILPLWAVRPVQNLSACTRAHFTLPLPLYYRKVKFAEPLKADCGSATKEIFLYLQDKKVCSH